MDIHQDVPEGGGELSQDVDEDNNLMNNEEVSIVASEYEPDDRPGFESDEYDAETNMH